MVAYLCCDDLDSEALRSVVGTLGRTGCRTVVHDDSTTAISRGYVDRTVSALRTAHDCDIEVLRRTTRAGGKPAALNHIVERLPRDAEYL